MSTFNEEISAAFAAESTITDLVSTDIYFHHLPENYNINSDALLYESSIVEAQHHIDLMNWGDTYEMRIKAVSVTAINVYTIGQAVKDYIKTYSSTNVQSIAFERDVYVYSDEENLHVLNLDFTVDYCN
jgi:hypothetical protein